MSYLILTCWASDHSNFSTGYFACVGTLQTSFTGDLPGQLKESIMPYDFDRFAVMFR
jgi:hypothetical protein